MSLLLVGSLTATMGERADAPPPAARPRRRPPAGQVVFALSLLALLAGALLPERPLDRAESAAVLMAGSLAGERDRTTGGEDRERAAALREEGHDAPRPLYGEALPGSLLHGLLLAPWVALGGARLALAAQLVLLAAAALLATRALERRAGRAAAWLGPLLLFGSVAGAQSLRLWPEPLLFALVLLAFALAEGPAPPPVVMVDDLPDVYPEYRAQPVTRSSVRWGAVGLLLGAVAAAAPWTLPLLWPAALRVPPEQRRAGKLALLASAAVALLLGITLAAATSGAGLGLESLRAALAAPFADVAEQLAPAASAWSLLYALAGRHLGVLFYFAPLLLLLPLGGGARGRATWLATLLALLLLALLRPFDLGAAEPVLGLRAFLPLWGALWLVAERPARLAELAAGWLLAAALLWPLWRAPHAPWREDGVPGYAAPYLAPWTPLETTQVRLFPGAPLDFGDGRLFVLPGEALGEGTVARVPAAQWLELLVGTPGELSSLWIEGGEQAGTDLLVEGGEVSETMFRPDGGVAFLVVPDGAWARHTMPGEPREWSFYRLRVRFPAPPGREFTIRVRPG